MKNLENERIAQMYALIAWNGKTAEEAKAMVESTTFEKLDETVYSKGSIDAAKSGIAAKAKELAGKNKYDAVIEILAGIHDNWVKSNAKKYDRGNEVKSEKQIFQHLPTALIGLDELAKDLMFLAPWLKEMGIDAGEMQKTAYGAFVPSEEIAAAYNRYVEKFKEEHKIESYEDLQDRIPEIVEEYEPLKGEDEVSKKRMEYMKKHYDTLAAEVQEKNEEEFKSVAVGV
ncbi:MAG: hypothetical protein MJ152_02400 [Clostridia bacterium]|nr:hypothetical protein [Clostridia bacterium]